MRILKTLAAAGGAVGLCLGVAGTASASEPGPTANWTYPVTTDSSWHCHAQGNGIYTAGGFTYIACVIDHSPSYQIAIMAINDSTTSWATVPEVLSNPGIWNGPDTTYCPSMSVAPYTAIVCETPVFTGTPGSVMGIGSSDPDNAGATIVTQDY